MGDEGNDTPLGYPSASSSFTSAGFSSTSSRPLLAPTSTTLSSTTSAMPAQTRTLKQRRVSLPGTSLAQTDKSALNETSNSFARAVAKGRKESAEPPVNGWGMTFRDDLDLPPSMGKGATTSAHQFSGRHHDHETASKDTVDVSSSLPAHNDASPTQLPSSTSMTTRRRRATTAAVKGKTREFAVPNDPVPATSVSPSGSQPETPAIAPRTGPGTAQPNDTSSTGGPPPAKPRKPRKRWTMEETQALVDGCNKWGVGNWKAILNDVQFQFQGRSPVDLKDRFRTYFPDAYRTHYPNAKTHLSTRIRSFLPDGTPIFAKTRSKKRRPFSAEEDAALRRGYEKYGTTWATIVKDPIFKGMERRSTDLRDRFRNAFPDLYKAAGYKPRPRAGTTSSATSVTAADTPVPSSKSRETKRGRKVKAETTVNTPTASRSVSKSTSRTASGRKKRACTTGHTPIHIGEPTAADFYRPRPSQSSQGDDEQEDLDVQAPSDSDQGESSEEDDYEDEERYYPLSAVSVGTHQGSTSSDATSTAKLDSQSQGWQRELSGTTMIDDGEEEDDMDVDGDVMISQSPPDDEGIDGTALSQHDFGVASRTSTRQNSMSEAGPPTESVLSPPSSVSRTIQDLLNSATAAANVAMMAAGNTDGLMYHHSHQQPFMQGTPSTASVNNSVTSDDWNSISSHGGYVPNGNLASNSPAHWMSNPTSPTPSDFYHHPAMPQGLEHHPGGGVACQSPSAPTHPRIGKSAWGPQDWLSNNPRLDHNLNILGGNGALTSWPPPPTDPHAVLDRYDLYSAVEAAHEFASEAAYGHHHHGHVGHTHAHLDDSIFREFTHHRYAGDLIPGSGLAVHPPNSSNQPATVGLGSWSFGALGIGLAALGNGFDTSSLQDDYSSVTSGSNIGIAGLRGALRDVDELSVVNYTNSSATPSSAASPVKRPMNPPSIIMNNQQNTTESRALDLDAMIMVDADDTAGPGLELGLGLGLTPQGGRSAVEQNAGQTGSTRNLQLGINAQGMEEAGAITPTSFPTSLPGPSSPLDRPRFPTTTDFSQLRRSQPSPARPHSRSVNLAHTPQIIRSSTPTGGARGDRSISQPPSEHRLALQRSLSYLDPITSSHAVSAGLFGPFVDEDPLAYNEPLSISSLDLQYGMSSGPNIFTPLTMFSDPPTIAPARTINSGAMRTSGNNPFAARPAQSPAPTTNAIVEEALDLSALIHTSPVPAPRNHQRHQSQSVTMPPLGDMSMRESHKRRGSWDGFDILSSSAHPNHQDDASFFLEFSRPT